VWDVDKGVCKRVLSGHSTAVNAVCALAHGCVVSASSGHTLRVWSTSTGECVRTMRHTAAVNAVCALADGRFVSASDDTTLRVWDAETGLCERELVGHVNAVLSVCQLVDGRVVSGAANDG
jgi:WD40 repeat protein